MKNSPFLANTQNKARQAVNKKYFVPTGTRALHEIYIALRFI